MVKQLFLHMCFLMLMVQASSANAYTKSQKEIQQGDLVDVVSYIYDSENQFTVDTIPFKEFEILESPRLGYENGVYWFKVKLKSVDVDFPLIFDVKENTIKSIDIYVDDQLIATNQNNIGTTNLSLKVLQNTNRDYLLKVDFGRQVYFPLKVYTLDEYNLNEKLHFFKVGWYYGFVFVILIINLFFYFSFKDNTFLWYSVFVVSTNLVLSNFDGFFGFFVKPTFLESSDILFHYLIPLSGAFLATNFLSLSIYLPKAKIIGAGLLASSAIFYIVFIITDDFLYAAIGDVISLLVLLYYWGTGVYILKTHIYARFFVIGYSLVLFSAILYVIPMDLGIEALSVSLNHVKFGALFEMLILTYAVSYRVKKIQEENESIQEEIKQYINQIYVLEEKLEGQVNENPYTPTLELKITELTKKHSLTDREVDVLLCVSKGYTHQKTAEELYISLNTVKYHTRNIYQKLCIKNKGEAMSILSVQ